jgi:hypothetical protein
LQVTSKSRIIFAGKASPTVGLHFKSKHLALPTNIRSGGEVTDSDKHIMLLGYGINYRCINFYVDLKCQLQYLPLNKNKLERFSLAHTSILF